MQHGFESQRCQMSDVRCQKISHPNILRFLPKNKFLIPHSTFHIKKAPHSPSKLRFLFSVTFLITLLYTTSGSLYADTDIDLFPPGTEVKITVKVADNQSDRGTVKCDPSNDGTTTEYSKTIQSGTVSTKIIANAKPGYEFEKWMYGNVTYPASDSSKDVSISSSTTYTAYFKPKTFSVSFNSKGGSAVSSTTIQYNTVLSTIKPADPTWGGHDFLGWFYDEAYTQAVEWNANCTKTSNFTLYAKWQCNVTATSVTPTTSATNNTICNGGSTTLSATAVYSPSDANVAYTWTKSGSTITNLTVSPTEQTSYTVTAKASLNGCSATTPSNAVTVYVNSPSIVLNQTMTMASPNPVCAGGNVSLDIAADSYTGVTGESPSWSWSGPNNFSSTQRNPTASNVSSSNQGNYTVIGTIKNTVNGVACTATATRTVNVTVNTPAVTLGTPTQSPNPLCVGSDLTLSVSASGTSGNVTYVWTEPSGTSSSANSSASYVVSGVDAHDAGTYTVTATATVGNCTKTDTKTISVSVNGEPIIGTLTQPNEVPEHTSFALTTPSVDGNGLTPIVEGDNYGWQITQDPENGPFTKFLNRTQDVTVAINGWYLCYVVHNDCGTTRSNVVLLRVSAVPEIKTAIVEPTSDLCEGLPLGINPPTVDGHGGSYSSEWQWCTTQNGTYQKIPDPDAIPYNGGSYWVRYRVFTSGGQQDVSNAVHVTVQQPPTLSLSNNSSQELCENIAIDDIMIITSSTATVTVEGLSDGLNSNQTSIFGTPSATCTYTVKSASTSVCYRTATGTITVNRKPTINGVTATTTIDAICSGGKFVLPDVEVTDNGSAITKEGWQVAASTSSNFSDFSNESVDYLYNGYWLRYYAVNGCGETATVAIQVTVRETPSAPTVTKGDTVCAGQSGSLTATVSGDNIGCKWYASNDDDTPEGTGNTFETPSTLQAGQTHKYYVSAYNTQTSCESHNRTAVAIIVSKLPVIGQVDPTDMSCHNVVDGKIEVTATPGEPAHLLSYTINNWASQQTENVFTGLSAGDYTVEVKNEFGCSATYSGTVKIKNPELLTVSITDASATSLCAGGSVLLQATVVNAAQGNMTCNWTDQNDNSVGNGNPFQASPTQNTTYKVNVTDANGCTASSSNAKAVTVLPAFNPGAITSGSTSIEQGGTVTTIGSTAAATGGAEGSVEYQWLDNGSPVGSSNSATFNPSAYASQVGVHVFTRQAKSSCTSSWVNSAGQYTLQVRGAAAAEGSTYYIQLNENLVVTRIDCWGGGGGGSAQARGGGGGGGGYAGIRPNEGEHYIPHSVIPANSYLTVTTGTSGRSTSSSSSKTDGGNSSVTFGSYSVIAGGGKTSTTTTSGQADGGQGSINIPNAGLVSPKQYKGGSGGMGSSNSNCYRGGGGGGAAGTDGDGNAPASNTYAAGQKGNGNSTYNKAGNGGVGGGDYYSNCDHTETGIGANFGGGGGGEGDDNNKTANVKYAAKDGAPGYVAVYLATKPQATISTPDKVCQGGTLKVTGYITWGGPLESPLNTGTAVWQLSSTSEFTTSTTSTVTPSSVSSGVYSFNSADPLWNNKYLRLKVSTDYGEKYSNVVQLQVQAKVNPTFATDFTKNCPDGETLSLPTEANNNDGITQTMISGTWLQGSATASIIKTNDGKDDKTYSVTFQPDNSYCAKDTTMTITVYGIPKITVTSDEAICVTSPYTPSYSVVDPTNPIVANHDRDGWLYRSSTKSGTYNTINLPSTLSYNAQGYYFTYFVQNYCATYTSDTVHIEVKNVPEISTRIVNNLKVCDGGTLSLPTIQYNPYAESYTAKWEISQYANSGDSWEEITSSTAISSGKNNWFLRYHVHNTCGDAYSDTVRIIVNDLPNATITATPGSTICLGSSTTLSANPGYTYAWSVGGELKSTEQNYIVSPNVNTEYKLYVIDANNCAGTDFLTVTVNSLPTVSVSPETITIGRTPAGETRSAQLTASGSSTSYKWYLDASETPVSTSNPYNTPSDLGNGDHTYTVVGTDGNGCSNTATSTVTVETPSVTLNNIAYTKNTLCQNESTTLTASVSSFVAHSGTEPVYTWSPSTGLNITTGAEVTATPTETTTYTVTATVVAGTGTNTTTATDTKSITITVNPRPSAPTLTEVTRTPDTFIVCGSGSSNITLTANPGDGNTCRWYDATGEEKHNGNSYQITSLSAGIYDYSVSAVNTTTNCESVNRTPAVAVIGVNPVITNITKKDIRCYLDNPEENPDADGRIEVAASSYFPATSLVYHCDPAPPQTSNVFDSLFAGTYTITVKDNFGCETTYPSTVTINNPPALSVSLTALPVSICQSESVALTATATNAQGAVTYTWKKGGTQLGTPTSTNTYTDNPTAASNSYSVDIKDSKNCTATATPQSVTVKDTVKLVVSGNLDQSFCLGQSMSNVSVTDSTAAQIKVTGLPAGVTYLNGKISGRPTASGTSTITIEAISKTGCTTYNKTKTLKITVKDTVKLVVSGNLSQSFCLGQSMTAVSVTDSSNATISVTGLPEGVTYTGGVISGSPTAAGNSNVTITASSTTECPVSDKTKILEISVKDTVTLAHERGNLNQTVCFGEDIDTITFSSNTTMSANPLPAGMSFMNGKLTGHPSTAGTHSYTIITNNLNDCGTKSFSGTVTMYPEVKMNSIGNDAVICNEDKLSQMNFTPIGLPTDSMTYSWSISSSNNNVFVITTTTTPDTLKSGNTNYIPKVKIVNNSSKIQTVTIKVVPHYGHSPYKVCDGDTVKRKITVYPKMSISISSKKFCSRQSEAEVTLKTSVTQAGTTTYKWQRTNEKNLFNGAVDTTWHGPVSSPPKIDYSKVTNIANNTQYDTIKWTMTFKATGYDKVCTKSSINKSSIRIYPNPGMNAISTNAEQYICHNSKMKAVTLSSRISYKYMRYQWTRDNTDSIGGLRDGTVKSSSSGAKIKDSVLTNTTNTEQITKVSVRPNFYVNDTTVCYGSDDSVKTFKIHVSPKAVMNDLSPNTQTLCHGEALSTVTFGTTIDPSGNVLYKWSRDNTNIGGIDASCESSCTGISSDAVTNTTNTAQATTITVTPKYYSSNFSSCNWETSSNRTFTITVNPETKMTAERNSDVISHDSLLTVTFNTNITDGTRTFHWKRDNNAVSQWDMEGTGNISVHPENTTSTPQVVNVKAWLSYTSGGETCTTSSDTVRFSITVNPRITMSASPEGAVACSGGSYTPIAFSTPLDLTSGRSITYKWTRTNDNITGLASSGESTSISAILSTTQTSQQTTHFKVTPWYSANGIECAGEPVEFDIKLKVAPTVSITQPAAICSGNTISSTETINDHGGTLTVSKWQKQHEGIWSDFNLSTPLNYENNGDKLRYVVENECGSNNSNEETITVYQSPATPSIAVTPVSAEICAGGSVTLTASSTNTDAGGFKWTLDDGTTSTANPYTVSNLSAGTHTVTVTQVSSHGCGESDAASQTIKVHNITITNVTANPTAVCGEGDVTLSATVNSSISGAASVVWTNNIGAVVGNESSIQVHPSTTTIYTVSASVPDAGCTATATKTVSVYPAFNPGAVSSGSKIVARGTNTGSVTVSNVTQASGGQGNITYQWKYRKNNGIWQNVTSNGTGQNLTFNINTYSGSNGTYEFTRWAINASCAPDGEMAVGQYTLTVGDTIRLDSSVVVTRIDCWGGGGSGGRYSTSNNARRGGTGGGGGGYAALTPINNEAYIPYAVIPYDVTLIVTSAARQTNTASQGNPSTVSFTRGTTTLYTVTASGGGAGSSGTTPASGGTATISATTTQIPTGYRVTNTGGTGGTGTSTSSGNGQNRTYYYYGGGGGGAAGPSITNSINGKSATKSGNTGSAGSGGTGYCTIDGNSGAGATGQANSTSAAIGSAYGGGGGGRGGNSGNVYGAAGIVVVTLKTVPSATITQPAAICENTSLSITPTISWGDGTSQSQKWQISSGTTASDFGDISNLNNIPYSYNNRYIRLAVTTEYGTRYSNAVQISVKQKQHPLFDLSKEYCPSGNDIALSNFANNSDGIHEGGIRGSWATTAAPSTAITSLPGDNTGASDLSYSIKFTHNNDYCAYDTTFTIKVWAKPNVSLSSNKDQTVCQGTSVTNITITANNANAAADWSFNKGGDNSSLTRSGQTISGTMANAGAFNYSVTVSSAHTSCTHTASATGTVTVTPYNTITLTSASTTDNQTVCNHSNIVNITYSTTGATGADFSNLPAGVSGSWNNNVVTISGTPTEGGTFNYTVTMTGGCTGGTNTATGTITVNDPQITLQALRDTTVCSGNQVKMEAVVTAHQSDNITYAWYKNGGTSAYKTVSSFTEAYNTTTSYRLVATASKTVNSRQCSVSDTTSATITVTNPSVTNLTITANPASICYGDSSTLTASCTYTGGSISYSWTGAGLGQTSGAVVKAGATGTAGSTTEYTVTATATSGSCTATDTHTVTVTVNPKVVMNTPSPVTICHNEGVNIPFSNSGTGLVEADMRYTWTSSNANVGGLTPGTVTSTGIVASALTNTTTQPQTTTITVTPKYLHNGIECTGTPINFTIKVNPEVKMNEPVVSPNTTICHEGSISMTFTTSLTGGTTTYTWTRDNTDVVGGTASGSGNISNLTLTNTNSTFKQTTFKVTPTFEGCTATASGQREITVSVNPKVVMDTPANDTICHNDALNITFTTTLNGGATGETTYAWTRDNTSVVGGTASGTTHISGLKLTNTTNQPQVTTFEVTPTFTHNNVSCTGTPVKFKVTVNPQVKMNHVADQTLCHGDNMTAVNFASALASANTRMSYAWNRDNTDNVTGLAGNGNGNIASTQLSNITTADQTSKFKVKPTYTFGKACTMTGDSTFKIVVNPKVIMVTPADVTMCNDSLLNVTFQSNLTPGTTTYSWTREGSDVSGTTSGSGNIQNLKLTNNTTSAKTTTFKVTPTYTSNGKACTDEDAQFVVTVYPRVQMDAIGNQHKCSGEDIAAVNFVHHITDGNVTFEWTRDNANVQGLGGLTGAVTADHIDVTTVTNTTTEPQVTTIMVTPIYTNGTTICRGEQRSFTITVNPEVKMNPISNKTLCNGEGLNVEFGTTLTVGTTSYAWTRNNTAEVGGTGSGNGNISGLTLTNSNTTYKTTTFTVTPTFTYGGKTCTATATNEQQFTVTVNPTVQMATPANDTICHNEQLNVTFSTTYTGGTVSYAWSRDNNSVGGTSSGNGNISNLTLTNTTNSPQTTEFTVTPTYTNGASCTGTVVKFKVTVNPQVKMNHVNNQALCHGDNMAAVNFASALASANTRMSYAWNRDNTDNVTGLAGSGSGNIASTQLSNITTADQTSKFTVKPTYTFGKACTMTGDSTFKIVVNPKVIMVTPADVTMCNDSLLNVTFQSNLTPGSTTYAWSRVGSDVSGTTSGSGNIQNLKLTNNTTSAKTTTFTVTPTYTSNGKACTDEDAQFVVTVYPRVQMDAIGNQHKCSGEDIAAVNFVHHITDGSVTFEWTRDNANVQGLGGLDGAVTADHIDVTTVTNTTNSPQVTTITVTPIYKNGTTTCRGEKRSFTITVNPEVKMDAVSAQSVCDGNTLTVNYSTALTDGTMNYSWTRTNDKITGIGGLTTPVTGNISATLSNSTLEAQTSTFKVIPTFTYNGVACTATQSNYRTFDVTVNKNPGVVSISGDSPICSPTSIELTASSTIPSAGSFVWSGEDIDGNSILFDDCAEAHYSYKRDSAYGSVNFSDTGTMVIHSNRVQQGNEKDMQIRWNFTNGTPKTYKYIQVRYRTLNSNAQGNLRIRYYLEDGDHGLGSYDYNNDGGWHIMTINAAKENTRWRDANSVLGIRVDIRSEVEGGVDIEFDHVAVLKSVNPLEISSPTVGEHKYYVVQASDNRCGYSEAASKTVEVKELQPGAITSGSSSIYPCENYSITNTTLAQCTSTSDVKYKWTCAKDGGSEVDIDLNATSLNQNDYPLSIPGVYVFKRYAASTCDACTASGDVWKVSTGTYTLTVKAVSEPGGINGNASAHRICANSYYGITESEAASEPGRELHYKWVVTRTYNGIVEDNYNASVFNNLNIKEFNTDNHPEAKLAETGLYIIKRYVWTGCDNGSAQVSDGDFRVAVLNPEQSIPGAVESNYYEICKGGIVTLTAHPELAKAVLPNYDNPMVNDTLPPQSYAYQYSVNGGSYSENAYGVISIDEVGTTNVRAIYRYANISESCYATSEAKEVVVREDPIFTTLPVSSAGENYICPTSEVLFTAGSFDSTIVGTDQPYYYSWKIMDMEGYDVDVSSEAYYRYEENGRLVHASNFTRAEEEVLMYSVAIDNALGCNANSMDDLGDYLYVYVTPLAPPLASRIDLCPQQGGTHTFSVDDPESYAKLRWYADTITTSYDTVAPTQVITNEGTFIKYVSQYSEADGCESARVPDTLVVRYTSHIAHVSGNMNQSLPQESMFTPSSITPIVFDYSYLSGDFYAVPVAEGLPQGVTGYAERGVFTISGHPTQSGVFHYSVSLQGDGCPQPTVFNGTLTVFPTYDTTVYFTGCGTESYTVSDRHGHSYTVNSKGTWTFGSAAKPLKTVLGYDSVVTVVYTTSDWNQFGFEEGTKVIASWTQFSSVASGIVADDGVNKTSSEITYTTGTSGEAWTSGAIINTKNNLTSTTCASTGGKSMAMANYAGRLQNGRSITIKTKTSDFADVNLKFDYGIERSVIGRIYSSNDIAFLKIKLQYSISGQDFQDIVEKQFTAEELQTTIGQYSYNLSLIGDKIFENQDNAYIKIIFSEAKAGLTDWVGEQYFLIDNICITGKKAITNLTVTASEEVVCTNGVVSLSATPPYVNTEGEEPDTTAVTYKWERIVDEASTVFAEGREYNIADHEIPRGYYDYVVSVGHGACLKSDTVTVLGVTPTYDTNTVRHAWVCSNEVDNITSYTFTDPDCQYVEGMAIRKPETDQLRTPGIHRCWLNIPYDGNLCGDSIISLDLEVRKAFDTTITEHICLGDVYDKYGIHFVPTHTGDTVLHSPDTWRCSSGCDSIYRVTIVVNSIQRTLTPEYGVTLAYWNMNTGEKSFKANEGIRTQGSRFNVKGTSADFTNESGSLKWSNLSSQCSGFLVAASYTSYSGVYFELVVNPKDYNNLKLTFDYLRNNASTSNAQAFNQVNYSYKFSEDEPYGSTSAASINQNGSWSSASIDFSGISSLDTDKVYLRLEFVGGNPGSTESCGSLQGSKYLPSFISIDNIRIVGDKPVRARLSKPKAYVVATEETKHPGDSSEFCEGNDMIFTAQEDSTLFNNPYFTFWLRDSVTGTEERFTTNKIRKDSLMYTTTWEVLARNEDECDTVFKFPVRINNSVHGILPCETDVCNNIPFSFVPQDGVHGEVPANVTYSWGAPDGGDYIRGTTEGSGQTSIHGTLINRDSVEFLQHSVKYTITPTANGCPGSDFTLKITVAPTVEGHITSPADQTEYCPGTSVTYTMKISRALMNYGRKIVWDYGYDTDTTYISPGYSDITESKSSSLPRACNTDYTITATYSDSAHCTVSDAITVKAVDRTPPTYTRPENKTLYVTNIPVAASDTLPSATGVPTNKSDLCSTTDDMFTVTHRDSIVAVCGHAEKIYRIWRVKDACGNVSVSDSIQLINVLDTVKLTVTSGDTSQVKCYHASIADVVFGGQWTDLAISPSSLPANLQFTSSSDAASGTGTGKLSGARTDAGTLKYTVTATNPCDVNTATRSAMTHKSITGTITHLDSLIMTVIVDSAECGSSNGTIMASATGGSKPYLFKVDGAPAAGKFPGVFNNVADGDHTVRLADNLTCPYNASAGSVTIKQLKVTDIKGVTRFGEVVDFDRNRNMVTRTGELDSLPGITQYGEVIEHDRTMENLTASATGNTITVSVDVTKVADAHTLEFQCSTDATFATNVYTKKLTNLSETTFTHDFPHLTAGTYYVRAILRTCHSETIQVMTGSVVFSD